MESLVALRPAASVVEANAPAPAPTYWRTSGTGNFTVIKPNGEKTNIKASKLYANAAMAAGVRLLGRAMANMTRGGHYRTMAMREFQVQTLGYMFDAPTEATTALRNYGRNAPLRALASRALSVFQL